MVVVVVVVVVVVMVVVVVVVVAVVVVVVVVVVFVVVVVASRVATVSDPMVQDELPSAPYPELQVGWQVDLDARVSDGTVCWGSYALHEFAHLEHEITCLTKTMKLLYSCVMKPDVPGWLATESKGSQLDCWLTRCLAGRRVVHFVQASNAVILC